jgi:hypothetical protein
MQMELAHDCVQWLALVTAVSTLYYQGYGILIFVYGGEHVDCRKSDDDVLS